MEKRRVGKFTVALTLIGLGLGLLFRDKFDFDLVYKLYLPAILIILGTEIIVSKYYYNKKGYSTRVEPLAIPLIIVIFLFLGFGISFEILDDGFQVDLLDEFKYGNKRTVSEELVFESEENVQLEFNYADLEVVESPNSEIEVVAEIEYRYDNPENSKLNVESFLNEKKGENTIGLVYDKAKVEEKYDIGIESVDYIIRVPRDVDKLLADVRYSDAEMYNIYSDIDLKSGYSDLDLYELSGNIDFDISYSDTYIENKNSTVGNIKGSARYSDIDIDLENKDIQNAVYDLKSRFGDIDVSGVVLDSRKSGIENNLEGTVGNGERYITISVEYGDVDID